MRKNTSIRMAYDNMRINLGLFYEVGKITITNPCNEISLWGSRECVLGDELTSDSDDQFTWGE